MPDFLTENNVCGQSVLQLVSRGNAIIAELLRLKDYIPQTFRLASKEDVQKYGEIILDFSYFKIEDAQNSKIDNSELLRDLDEVFRSNNIDMVNRFYLTFESIHKYITDLNRFLEELDEGFFIHQSLDTIFADVEGKQLLCEALYLYGLMLLIIDAYIDGPIRERLLVSYYRYTPQRSDTQSRIDDICKLLRDTAYNASKKPNNYPEDYFQRISVKTNFVEMVIGHLRSDDIYGQLAVYPLPKHRSTALAQQASMLFVCLFFAPDILHSQTATMREIVDKFFPDNWIISLYMGFVVNLAESWEHFKAAKLALNNTLELINVKNYASSYGIRVDALLKATNLKLKEGNLASDDLLKDVSGIIDLLRDCNFTIRWLMLHTILTPGRTFKNKKLKQIGEVVMAESKLEQVQLFKLLLNTAQLELITRDTYKNLLCEKENQWKELKEESHKRLHELAEVFGGTKPLTTIQKNENLQHWFLQICKQVETLDDSNSSSLRKIAQLIQALEEVQEFHQLESHMQVVQFLSETRKCLHKMICNMNIKEDVLITLQIIGDLSYAWELIDSFTSIMQRGIQTESTLVIKLRAIFLKLASALEVPLLRINQAHSEDFVSVSQYYSSELEIYVRKVLQIIPKMMFEKMARIIQVQTSVLKELPTRLDKEKLKDYAQLNERFEYAELTHSISVFSQGMRMMKSTLVGVICLDPRQLLEDGIRKELVQYISKALHFGLIFNHKSKTEVLEQQLIALGFIMDGYKRSFEYIQDYINVNGLKIWQEELTRIINYNVEQECNGFLRNKVHAWQSAYQSRHVPIPVYPSSDNVSANFIGRLAREIIHLTDPRQAVYLDQTSSWYDIKSRKCIFNKESIVLIVSTVEISGLVGLDRFFSFMIVSNLQKISRFLKNDNTNSSWHNILFSIQKDIRSVEHVQNPVKFYQSCVSRTTKVWNEFLESVLITGQLQLLRTLIALHLNKSLKFNAKNLESSLQSLNKTLLLEVTSGKYTPCEELMLQLSHYFDYSGLNNAFTKIYISSDFNEENAVTIFIFVIAHLTKLFVPKSGHSNKKSVDHIDGTSFVVAVHTLVRQFHPKLNEKFIELLSDYVVNLTKNSISAKTADLALEVGLAMYFLETYTNYAEISRKCVNEEISEDIFHTLQTLVAFPS